MPGTYMAGKIGIPTKLSSDGPGDGSVKSALQPTTGKLSSAIACPAAVDKRKTVTAIRSLSITRNSTTKSVPLKAMPSAVTPTVLDRADGVFEFSLDILLYYWVFQKKQIRVFMYALASVNVQQF